MSILSNDDVYTIQSYKRSYVLVLIRLSENIEVCTAKRQSIAIAIGIGYSEIDKLLHPFDVRAYISQKFYEYSDVLVKYS